MSLVFRDVSFFLLASHPRRQTVIYRCGFNNSEGEQTERADWDFTQTSTTTEKQVTD